ncbi:MAG: hypothetical protein ABFR19_04605 [Pseudomonadota bacterium]
MDVRLLANKAAASFAENRNTYIAALSAFVAGFGLCIGIGLMTDGTNVETPPDLETTVQDRIHDTVTSTDVQKDRELASDDEFDEAVSQHHSEIIARLSEVKDVEVDVQILMAGRNAESAKTANCYNWFMNLEYHAELVIPESYPGHRLSWLRCDASWPEMYLALNINGIPLQTPVKLVGVRRNGRADTPVLLISQKIAQDLELDGWEEFKSKASGTLSLASVK